MKNRIIGIFVLLFLIPFVFCQRAFADSTQTYSRGIVRSIDEQTQQQTAAGVGYTQKLRVQEEPSGKMIEVQNGSNDLLLNSTQLHHVGEEVVLVSEQDDQGNEVVSITDQYRIPPLLWLLGGFFIVVFFVARFKGLQSVLGMFVSLGVLLFYMVPQITHGADPVVTSLIASTVISAVIIYFGHSFNMKSHVALLCMVVTLFFTAGLAAAMVKFASLAGTGSDEAIYVQTNNTTTINLQGLLLGGIILAALSVLDDSVVSQVSVIAQLIDIKPHVTLHELYERGMEVGKDHISTLVNTLILAYAGSSLPLFILFSNASSQPVWVALNDQMIAEEVVRTLTGSIGLVLSIPLSTLVASVVLLHFYHTKKQR
ncbi:hypothetical protein C5B42_04555 [Candidatus Cerribacteria bacterium 'Amazon FNV 2010 28 9']|uniref:YibE/F family protein n=1 Tax=Candidatus Cerribacteria bacterium 'Amazon FNV 2010 28 9' TaxID=2081795 RepID=A0A317JP53_9BACT|nr:MAG: hypothetical protein C5B42_04555 [Candidatus Cerribacteria bacterium 'Amazon FNV 2010 28 9']